MSRNAGNRILIFEPNEEKREAQKVRLRAIADRCVWCRSEAAVRKQLSRYEFSAAVLCLDAVADGYALVERLAKILPVLIATAADALEMRIAALNNGAHDYLITPFGVKELLARIATVTYQNSIHTEQEVSRCGRFALDVARGRIGDGMRWCLLTPHECLALTLFCKHVNTPVSKDSLKNTLAQNRQMSDNAIEVIVHRLRVKLRSLNVRIRTYRGMGYLLESG